MVKHYEITKIDKDRYSVHKRDSYVSGGFHPFDFESFLCIIVMIFLVGPIGGGIFFWILGQIFGIRWLGFMLGTKLGFVIAIIGVLGFTYLELKFQREK